MPSHSCALYLLLIIICIVIIYNNYKKIKHYESIMEYYKWRSCVFQSPLHSGKYLLQYSIKDNDEHQIVVTHYNARKKEWVLSDDLMPVAWCHLPNYLYPTNK